MIEEPAFVHELLDRILAYDLAIIARACAFPIDAMMFGDDWGQQRGLIMARFSGGSSSDPGCARCTRP